MYMSSLVAKMISLGLNEILFARSEGLVVLMCIFLKYVNKDLVMIRVLLWIDNALTIKCYPQCLHGDARICLHLSSMTMH